LPFPQLRVTDVLRRNKRETIDQVIQFPEHLGAHAMLMIFRKYKYEKPGTRQLNKVGASTFSAQTLSGTDSILVPLPQSIQDTYQVRVQRLDQGIAGESVAAASRAISEASGSVIPSGGDLLRIAATAMPAKAEAVLAALMSGDFSGMARDAAFLARRSIDAILPEASRNIDVGFGNTINPKAALYFEGVEMKAHSFNWSFSPSTEHESDILRNLGNTIKKNVLPSYGSVVGAERILLNYPSVLDIFFLGVDQSYFLHYKTCMVQTFNIDFTPHGIALLRGGKPATINMSLNVIEADIHTSEDYDGAGTTMEYSQTPGSERF
jgi:hypothetical protein